MENTTNVTNNHSSAKYAFFYMLSLVALVFMALAAGMIIFQIINKNIVDVIRQYSGSYSPEAMKFAISALLISTPIFYFTIRQIYKNLFSGALDKDAGVRRWLTYFILLVASVVMIGWLIGTVNSFLDGELTIKFILKALTAIAISAIIFSFYLYDIRREEVVGKKDQIVSIYFYGSLVIVIGVFAASLFFVESPAETRNRKLDLAVIDNFSQIDSAINSYYIDQGVLPENLNTLIEEVNYLTENDTEHPISKTQYEYKVTGEKTYELCADFKTSNKYDEENGIYIDKRWLHQAGYQCLSQKIYGKGGEEPPERFID